MKKKLIHYVDSPLYKLEYTARFCSRYFSLFFKENFSCLGITEGEYAVMDTIVRTPDISQIELARLLFKGRSHITQILNALENKELIERVSKIKNNRKIRQTVLTKKGEELYQKIKGTNTDKFKKMCEFFDKKEDEFVGMLSEIQGILTEGKAVTFD